MRLFDDRLRYRPGLGLRWSRVPLLVGSAAVWALAAGWLIGNAHDYVLLPGVLTLFLAALMPRLVVWSHCRNPWIAGGVAAAAGLGAYFGYFIFGDNPTLPRREMRRLDFELRHAMGAELPTSVDGPLVLLAFCGGIVFAAGVPAVFAARCAGRAYCPALRRWMRRETALLPANGASDFCRALAAGRVRELVAEARAIGPPTLCCRLTLEYAPVDDATVIEHPVYATLADVPPGRVVLDVGVPRRLVRQILLTPDEVRSLAPLFPELDLLLLLPESARPLEAKDAVAQITPVPEPYRRRVRRGSFTLTAEFLDFIRGMGIGLGMDIVLVSVAIGFLWFPAVAYIGVPCGLVMFTAAVCFGPSSDRWVDRRIRREIGNRPDRTVDPDDPEALAVAWQVRASFLTIGTVRPSDLMFLKVCPANRAIIMEGDDRRYRIPAEAVLECDPLSFNSWTWRLRLLVRTADGPREFLLQPGTGRPAMWPKSRLPAVESLRARIEALKLPT